MHEKTADARLAIGASELDADLYYLTRFRAPDAFVYIEVGGRSTLLMSDLEIDRARTQARVDEVLSLSAYEEKAKQQNITGAPAGLGAVLALLQERGAKSVEVPSGFAVRSADFLRDQGLDLSYPEGAYVVERELKSESEIDHIREVQQATEDAMDVALTALRQADVEDGVLVTDGRPLTAEDIKKGIALLLLDRGITAKNTIVACGDQACDPHNEGSGPLCADQPIVIDIFPRSDETGYYADITRTVIKGEPTKKQVALYKTVLEAQMSALDHIAAGVDGKEIHDAVNDRFIAAGFETGEVDGRMQGFFHGTGHGLGLEIHEPPRITRSSQTLKAGHVVTVEPGLYYPGLGGVRIEDLVVVTENGCENLTRYPKEFQL